jgi:diacylglycerol O-acyltransferase
VGSRRRVAFAAVGLEDVKRLKNAMGVTVNDVVLGLATSALRRYLEEGDELPDQALVAVVPVSVRPEMATMHGSNKVSAMFVPLPVNEPVPLRRLQLIHDSTKGAKEEHDALGADTLKNWAEHSSPNVFGLAVRAYTKMRLADRHRPVANLVVSNVPGPDFPLYFGGAEMQACFPLGPIMEGMGLNVTIMSYRGVLYWGFVSCAKCTPRLWDMAASVPEALDDMLADAGLAASASGVPVDLGPGMPHARPASRRPRGATVTALQGRARSGRSNGRPASASGARSRSPKAGNGDHGGSNGTGPR